MMMILMMLMLMLPETVAPISLMSRCSREATADAK
jgi:hypothetical protein